MKDEVEVRVPKTEELDSAAATSVEEEDQVAYDRLRRHPKFHSNILSADRDIIVYVPEGYDESDRRYPVLYLHDGQNLFDRKTAYVKGRIWAVHETADRLIAEGAVEPLIIVGIYNTGAHRLAEYTPTRNQKMGGGDADLYGLMLIEEVKPFIDNEYRTLGDRENTGLGGSSLGGLVTLFLGLAHPNVFGKLAVLSPSVWWDHKSILAFVNEAEPEIRPRIWLDMGTREGGKSSLNDSVLLHKLLLKRGWRDNEDLLYMRVEGGTHDEAAWAKRVEPFLRFLFPAR
jgi:predicted alpha/beta superfamily hydrolase